MAPDTWNLSWPNFLIVQQFLVVYLENFLWNIFSSCYSHNIWTICVFQLLFTAISYMRRFVSRGKLFFDWI